MGKAELSIEIDADLLARAKESSESLEALVEAGLRTALASAQSAQARGAEWAAQNADAIKVYNQRVAKRGLISDEFRTW
jgi:antitoxin CcdA